MTGTQRAVARRYARALLDVAASAAPGTARTLDDELAATARTLDGHSELRRTLLSPALPTELRRRVLEALAESGSASPLLRRLLGLLAARGRLELMPTLSEEFTRARQQREGRVAAEAVTAVPLSTAQREALAEALQRTVGKTVELSARVDAAVLGGVQVTVDGRTYDGTVRTRLRGLRTRLAAGR